VDRVLALGTFPELESIDMPRAKDLIRSFNDDVGIWLKHHAEMVKATDLGLDSRGGYSMWVSNDAIIIQKDKDRFLQYYGGFEYVEKDSRAEVGDFVFYYNSDSRVGDCLDFYEEKLFEKEHNPG
jgi:hypothetical protein